MREPRVHAAEFCTQDGEIRAQDGEFCTQDGEIRTQDGEFCTRGGEIRTQDGEICTRGGETRAQDGEFCTRGGEIRTRQQNALRRGDSSSVQLWVAFSLGRVQLGQRSAWVACRSGRRCRRLGYVDGSAAPEVGPRCLPQRYFW
ncbi:hypothetical protein ABZ639_13145 [Saccharomonospora sp. NPDC006951]